MMPEHVELATKSITAVQLQVQEALKPVTAMQQRFQEAMQPLAELQERLQALQIPAFAQPEWAAAIERIVEGQSRFVRLIENLDLGRFDEIIAGIARIERNRRALATTGWLPHHSTPFEAIEACTDDTEAVHALLLDYYETEWASLRQAIELRLEHYAIDDEAKATFREALDAHENGLYRCVCRVLLPEIERVCRIAFHNGEIRPIASQHRLREVAGELTPGSIAPGGLYVLILFEKLQEHLYANVWSETDRHRFANDPIPNRHAAIHGLVIYSSMQTSLNTIFMAEYILQIISALKHMPEEDAA